MLFRSLSLQVDQQATLLAYGDVFRLVGLLFALVIPLVLLLGRPGAPGADDGSPAPAQATAGGPSPPDQGRR